MKFTAVFLGNKNNVLKELGTQFKAKYKTDITKITKNVIFYLYIGVLVIVFSFFARYIKITPKILYFATNFRQAQYDTFEVADLLNIYSIYNKNNYIINTSLMDNKEENEQNKQEVYNSDYEALDSVAEEAKAAQVFFSKPSQVTVTENSASIQRVTINTMKVLNYSTNRNIDFKTLENNHDFLALLNNLNEEEKTIIILYYDDNNTINEIANILNLNENTVKSKIKRAKEKIKLYIERCEKDEQKH